LKSHSLEGDLMNKLNRKCAYCGLVGVAKEEVFWVANPYLFEVEERVSKEWLHVDCEIEIARDV
jgi:hypothetical protein